LGDLTPKDGFIAAEPIEDETGQIGEAQKATREVAGGIDRFRFGAGRITRFSGHAVRSSIRDRVSPREHRVDHLLRVRVKLAGLPELMTLVGLHFEQAGFYGGGAAQPPQQAG
jgi:hypothetical protein